MIYGLAFAYLLAPIVDFFDAAVRALTSKINGRLLRALSILLTWLLVLALLYLMFSILIPELADSIATLVNNFESYYKTIYGWVTRLMEDNPTISAQVLDAFGGYYNDLSTG